MLYQVQHELYQVQHLASSEAELPRKKGTKYLHILVTPETHAKISAHAETQGFKAVSDYIRSLITADMKAHGVQSDLDMEWGGHRERDSKSNTGEIK